MKRTTLLSSIVCFFISTISFAQDITGVITKSKNHTTLITALNAADLTIILQGDGPFTVFAPTDTAFDKLPAGTVAKLLKPENKTQLSSILTYHVIPGNLMATDVIAAIKQGGGSLQVETLHGTILIATLNNNKVVLTDASGTTAIVTATNLKGSNGVIHVIDTVLMPE